MTKEMRTRIQSRFLRDSIPVRLGGIAANLARINSFSRHPQGRNAVESNIDETKHFIEWLGPELVSDDAFELVTLQRKLTQWHRSLDQAWDNPAVRQELSEFASYWSDRLLEMSGLLKTSQTTSPDTTAPH